MKRLLLLCASLVVISVGTPEASSATAVQAGCSKVSCRTTLSCGIACSYCNGSTGGGTGTCGFGDEE